MQTGWETGWGLDVVLGLQAARNPLFDALAVALHTLGGDLFLLIALPLIYWSLNRRLGARLLFALIFVGLLNAALKNLFRLPRPVDVSELVEPLVVQTGYGLPSGHVMLAIGVWGYAAHYIRRRAAYLAVGAYVLLMAWGRVYAGVHYPQDILAGAFFGLIALALFIALVDRFPDLWDRLPLRSQTAMIVLATLVAFVFAVEDEEGVAQTGALLGAGLGALIEGRWIAFDVPTDRRARALCYGIGLALVGGLFFGLRPLAGALATEGSAGYELLRMLRYALVVLAAYALWPGIALRLGLLGQRHPASVQGAA